MNAETQALFDSAARGNLPPEGTSLGDASMDEGTIEDHAARFGPNPTIQTELAPVEDIDPVDNPDLTPEQVAEAATVEPPKTRTRAASQKAKPEDVPTIAALTRELRTLQDELGIKRQAGESPRVFELRQRLDALKVQKAQRQPAPAASVAPAPSGPTEFTETEPLIEQYADKADPYSAWQRAVAAYDRRKETFDAGAAQRKTAQGEQEKAQQANNDRLFAAFGQRVKAYQLEHKDYADAVKAVEHRPNPALLVSALVGDDDGPKYIHHLAKNATLYDEMFILTDNKPVTVESVAAVQRLLKARMPAVTTGSVASSGSIIAPRPPNPVRTGPMKTSETPPGDDGSLEDHARHYGSTRRRR